MSQCRLPGHNHLWRDCPNNQNSKKFCGVTARTLGLAPSSAIAAAPEGAVAAAAAASTAKYAAMKRRQEAESQPPPPALAAGPPTSRKRLVGRVRSPPMSSVAPAATAKSCVDVKDTVAARPIPRKAPPKSAMVAARAIPRKVPGEFAASSNSMFNITNVARQTALQNSIESNGKRDGGSGIPKKRKFQPLPQPQQQSNAPSQQELHIKASHQQELVNVGGRWQQRLRAPSGVNAVPLQRHTSTRLISKNKSTFDAPSQRSEDGVGCREVDRHGNGGGSVPGRHDSAVNGIDESESVDMSETVASFDSAHEQSRSDGTSRVKTRVDGTEPRSRRSSSGDKDKNNENDDTSATEATSSVDDCDPLRQSPEKSAPKIKAKENAGKAMGGRLMPGAKQTLKTTGWKTSGLHNLDRSQKESATNNDHDQNLSTVAELRSPAYFERRREQVRDTCFDSSSTASASSTSSASSSVDEVKAAYKKVAKMPQEGRNDSELGQKRAAKRVAAQKETRKLLLPEKTEHIFSKKDFDEVSDNELGEKDGAYVCSSRKNLQQQQRQRQRQRQQQHLSVSNDSRHGEDMAPNNFKLRANAKRMDKETNGREKSPSKITAENTLKTIVRSTAHVELSNSNKNSSAHNAEERQDHYRGERKMDGSISFSDDRMAAELEADLFDLVDHSIEVSDQWNRRISLSFNFFDEEEDPGSSKGMNDGNDEGDSNENNGKANSNNFSVLPESLPSYLAGKLPCGLSDDNDGMLHTLRNDSKNELEAKNADNAKNIATEVQQVSDVLNQTEESDELIANGRRKSQTNHNQTSHDVLTDIAVRQQISVQETTVEAARAKVVRMEAVSMETSKCKNARMETARKEAARVKAAIVKPARTKTAKTDARAEAAKVVAARTKAAKMDAASVEAARVEATRVEVASVETARESAVRVEAAREAAAREAAANEKLAKGEAAKEEAYRENAAARVKIAKKNAAKGEATKVETVRTEADKEVKTAGDVAVNAENVRAEASRLKDARTETARTEAARKEAAREEVAKVKTARLKDSKMGTEMDSARVEVAKADGSREEAARAEAAKTEASKAEKATDARSKAKFGVEDEPATGDLENADKKSSTPVALKETNWHSAKVRATKTNDKHARNDGENNNHKVAVERTDNVTDSTIKKKIAEKEDLALEKPENAKKRQKKGQKKRKHVKDSENRNNAKKQKYAGKPWTEEEKELYLQGLKMCGYVWGEIANKYVTTRTPLQIRQYAKSLLGTEQHLENIDHNGDGKRDYSNQKENQSPSIIEDIDHLLDVDNASMNTNDDPVPAFVTCNKCSLVFIDAHKAWRHENSCTISTQKDKERGIVFNDKKMLIQHIVDLRSRNGKLVSEEDMLFFHPEEGRRYIVPDLNASRKTEEKNNGCNQNRLEDVLEDKVDAVDSHGEDTEMNLVKQLSSTTVDPVTGFPTQKLTVMSGDSGACCFLLSTVRVNAKTRMVLLYLFLFSKHLLHYCLL